MILILLIVEENIVLTLWTKCCTVTSRSNIWKMIGGFRGSWCCWRGGCPPADSSRTHAIFRFCLSTLIVNSSLYLLSLINCHYYNHSTIRSSTWMLSSVDKTHPEVVLIGFISFTINQWSYRKVRFKSSLSVILSKGGELGVQFDNYPCCFGPYCTESSQPWPPDIRLPRVSSPLDIGHRDPPSSAPSPPPASDIYV